MALSQEFLDEVETSLGGSLVSVELEPADYEICFKKARRTFYQKGHYGYRRDFYQLPVTKNQQSYSNIPEEIEDVVKVIKPTIGSTLSSASVDDPFSMVAYNQLFFGQGGTGCQRADFVSYDLAMQMAEERNKYTMQEIQFDYDPFRHTFYALYPPERDENWLLESYRKLDDIELEQIDWIIRWTAAEAKYILGVAYRKFSSLPGPTGETQLDGQSLVQESKDEKQELLEEIDNYVDGAMDYNEITIG